MAALLLTARPPYYLGTRASMMAMDVTALAIGARFFDQDARCFFLLGTDRVWRVTAPPSFF